jgi:hypothetical protein
MDCQTGSNQRWTFHPLWKDADPDIPILKEAKAVREAHALVHSSSTYDDPQAACRSRAASLKDVLLIE